MAKSSHMIQDSEVSGLRTTCAVYSQGSCSMAFFHTGNQTPRQATWDNARIVHLAGDSSSGRNGHRNQEADCIALHK